MTAVVTDRSGARGVRAVALIEAAKGVLALLGALGLLRLVHRDVRATLESVLEHLRLNPAAREPAVLLRLAEHATDHRLRLLAAGVLLYAGVRLVEAWGLWQERRWADWVGITTAVAYVPVELVELVRHPKPLTVLALVVNLLVLALLVRHAARAP